MKMKRLISVMIPLLAGSLAMAQQTVNPRTRQVEPTAGSWRTWVLRSGQQVNVPPPPGPEVTARELHDLQVYAAARTPEIVRSIEYWSAGSPSYRWVQTATTYVERRPQSNPRNTRLLAMLNVAVYDAMVSAWNAKYSYGRPRPVTSPRTGRQVPASPSYPNEIAVAAGAAATVLAAAYPDDAAKLRQMADEAAQSQVYAGVAYPSDAEAGLTLGRTVAQIVLDYCATDGSALAWTGSVPTGPGLWTGTPSEPGAGQWRPWVLDTTSMYRPGPPLAYDSAEKRAELDQIKTFPRTFATNQKAFFYQAFEGIFTTWYDTAHQRIFEYGLETNAPRAARIYALMSVAHHDAILAGWEAKFTYWAIRPVQLDKDVNPLFPTPSHPSYPAAHGFVSGAITRVLEYLFPNEAAAIKARGDEAAESRIWAGIHFRSDVTEGLKLGRTVADQVIARARRDGSE
jgi:hypothetical protein